MSPPHPILFNSSALSPISIALTPDQSLGTSCLFSDVIRNARYPRTFALVDLYAQNIYSLRSMHSVLSHFLQLSLYMLPLSGTFLILLFKITVALSPVSNYFTLFSIMILLL